MKKILGPGTLISDYGKLPTVINRAGVLWEDGQILEIGDFEELKKGHPGAEHLNAHGGLILPGLVNAHHHFYSALARGLNPGRPMPDFQAILKHLWWTLDRALDEESVRISAALSLADCIRHGCTTVIDHHASPSCVSGSLDLIAEELASSGLRAILCYEISDRNSHDEAMKGLKENLRFAGENTSGHHLRGLLGLHASFTISDDTLRETERLRPPELGIHIHLAEDPSDNDLSLKRFGARPLERLKAHGLLDERALLIHGLHLEEREYAEIAKADATLVHNPESNANNGVGRLDLLRPAQAGCRLGLGTDGMSSSMLRSLRAAFLGLRGGSRNPLLGFDIIPGLLESNAGLARRYLDLPSLGRLEAGAPADIIVIDSPPPTPLGEENYFGHLVYGASEYPCRHTIAGGRILLRDFLHVSMDMEELSAEAGSS